MKTIIDKNNGKVLFSVLEVTTLQPNEIAIDELLTETFINPYFNTQTRVFYEGATTEETEQAIKLTVPAEVQLWRIRTVLKLMQLEETIASALNQLEEPTKTGALYIWDYGTTVERGSATIQFLQSVLQMSDEQVDQIFIQANNIVI